MKTIFAFAAFASGAFAQFDQNSGPFRLFLKSDNATIDALGACHQGAAIEGFCPSGLTRVNESTSYDTFYHQTQADPTASDIDGDPWGPLVWNLTVNGDEIVPSTMHLDQNIMSNVVNPTILPGNDSYTPVSFTSGGYMYIPNYQDDTVTPPKQLDPPQKVENWYTCLTNWGYLYVTLNWKIGTVGVPQNPTCQKVQVAREFI